MILVEEGSKHHKHPELHFRCPHYHAKATTAAETAGALRGSTANSRETSLPRIVGSPK